MCKIKFYSNAFFRNPENEEDLYQNFTCQGISYIIILKYRNIEK